MNTECDRHVIAELIDVYTSATATANEAAQRSRDSHLPMLERAALRHRALQYQELADQALRMVNELTAQVAA